MYLKDEEEMYVHVKGNLIMLCKHKVRYLDEEEMSCPLCPCSGQPHHATTSARLDICYAVGVNIDLIPGWHIGE